MNEKKSKPGELKHFYKIPTSEISVEEDDIFYRKKYNEIINFFKYLLTIKKSEIDYGPKGLLLISSPLGTDIIDYIKLISKNYYLDLYQLKPEKALKQKEKFPKQFLVNLENLMIREESKPHEKQIEKNGDKKDEQEEQTTEPEKKKKIKLVIVDENIFRDKINKEKYPLEKFISYLKIHGKALDLLRNKVIMVWLNYDASLVSRIGSDLFRFFDLYLKIPRLTVSEQEIILNNFSEQHEKLRLENEQILQYIKRWEVQDIKNLLNVTKFKHQINSDLTEEDGNLTPIIIDLITSGEYFPMSREAHENVFKDKKTKKKRGRNEISDEKDQESDGKSKKTEESKSYLTQIKQQKHSEFMLNQFYEEAASKNYDDLLLIIEKIKNNEPLGKNARKILGKYPFILNEEPNRAQINLEKAKKRIDQIQKIYEKE